MSLLTTYEKESKLFLKACYRLAANMFVTGYGGNLAWKVEDNVIMITPTMMNKGDIQKDDLVFAEIYSNVAEDGQTRLWYLRNIIKIALHKQE